MVDTRARLAADGVHVSERPSPVARRPRRRAGAGQGDTRAHAAAPRYGCRRAHAIAEADGWQVGRRRVDRLWRHEEPCVPQKQRTKRCLGAAGGGATRRRSNGKDDV